MLTQLRKVNENHLIWYYQIDHLYAMSKKKKIPVFNICKVCTHKEKLYRLYVYTIHTTKTK